MRLTHGLEHIYAGRVSSFAEERGREGAIARRAREEEILQQRPSRKLRVFASSRSLEECWEHSCPQIARAVSSAFSCSAFWVAASRFSPPPPNPQRPPASRRRSPRPTKSSPLKTTRRSSQA